MGNNTKLLLTFIGGTVIGALVSFAVTKEKIQVKVDEKLESMEKYYKSLGKENKTEKKETNSKLPTDISEKPTIQELMEKQKPVVNNYNNMFKQPETMEEPEWEEIEEEDDYDEPRPDAHPPADEMTDKPFVISNETFDETLLDRDKITLFWYAIDGVLTDEQEEIIPDIETVVSFEALENFGMNPYEPDVVYTRNNKLGADYEICRVNESYKEAVLGIMEGE